MSSAASPQQIFVYYKVKAPAAAEAARCFSAAADGSPVQLLQRVDGDPSFLTWMELYPAVPGMIELEQRIAAAMQAHVQGPRHREVFAALA